MSIKNSIDYKLLGVIIFLMIFGLVMLFSSSIYHAQAIFKNPHHFINRQLIYLVFSLVMAFGIFRTPLIVMEKYSIHLFLITLFLLVLVFIPGIGHEIQGSYRWLGFAGLTFQPSEMLKLTIILFMSGFLIRQEDNIKNNWHGLASASLVVIVVALLLLLETDIGAFLIIATTVFSMLFLAQAKIKLFLSIITTGIISVPLVILLLPERVARISAFIDPWSDPHGKSYQLVQSLIAIGSGQWTGVGLGASVRKEHFLPDAHTDFIFAVIGEELGVIGMLLVLISFAYVIYKGLSISNQALKQSKKYSAYTAFGISICFALQIIINLGVNTGLLPTKGLTLPLFSYGGSSLLMTILTLAILFRIDGENRQVFYQNRQKNYINET